MTYLEKLRDPRWQKKRLEILKKRNFACEDCGSKENTLHIHHCYYEKGTEPWEYDGVCYKCLCEDCHKKRGKIEASIKVELARLTTSELGDLIHRFFPGIKLLGINEILDPVGLQLSSMEEDK